MTTSSFEKVHLRVDENGHILANFEAILKSVNCTEKAVETLQLLSTAFIK